MRGTANPAPQFQWHKDGEEIHGAHHHELKIREVEEADVGTYTCTVHNRCVPVVAPSTQPRRLRCVTCLSPPYPSCSAGAITSAAIIVSQEDAPPVFTQHPESKDVHLGDELVLEALASGIPRPSLQWMVRGVGCR